MGVGAAAEDPSCYQDISVAADGSRQRGAVDAQRGAGGEGELSQGHQHPPGRQHGSVCLPGTGNGKHSQQEDGSSELLSLETEGILFLKTRVGSFSCAGE